MDAHNRKTRKKLSNYLEGKRVAIVGPAASIVGSNQGELIDSYDVVVRLNKALPVPQELRQDVGTRTDIMYNCMNPMEDCGGVISIKTLRRNKVKFLIGAYPPLEKVGSTKLRIKKDTLEFYGKHRNAYQNFCYTDRAYFLKIWKHMRLPNTGTIAILDLLRFNIKELYITGITFFKGGYIRTYRNYDEKGILSHMKRFDLHKPSKQLDYACRQLIKDSRVVMDSTLRKIARKRYNVLMKKEGKPQLPEESEDDDQTVENQTAENQIVENDQVGGGEDDGAVLDVQENGQDYSDDTLNEMSSSSVQIYTKC